MKEVNHISETEKDKIASKMDELYNPNAIGQIEKYPPNSEHFVTLYFSSDKSFTLSNRYNVPIERKENPENDLLCNFEVSNIAKSYDEINITVKVTKQ